MIHKVIAGADVSGAKETPNQTWVALGRLDGTALEIFDLHKIDSHRLAVELNKVPVLHACGLDFPFSVPGDFLEYAAKKEPAKPFQSWQEVVEHFVFQSYEDFINAVKAQKQEPKRVTDAAFEGLAESPLHDGDRSVVHLTHQGMKLLAGLNPERFAVQPFSDPKADGCAVLEVLPEATLKALHIAANGYHARDAKDFDKSQKIRRALLDQLIELRDHQGIATRDCPRLHVDQKLEHFCVESSEALDAVIACYTAAMWTAAPQLFDDPFSQDDENVLLEGWIYAPVKVHGH